jgi:hypothetical protein
MALWRNGPDPSLIMASLQGISRTHLVPISTAKWAYLQSALADEMRVIAFSFKELEPINRQMFIPTFALLIRAPT